MVPESITGFLQAQIHIIMTSIINKVSDYCWSNDFLSIFLRFFEQNCAAFELADSEDITKNEHTLTYYNIFQEYLLLYEKTLTNHLNNIGSNSQEFYRELSELESLPELDEDTALFLRCLQSSTEYESFYKIMSISKNKLLIKLPDSEEKCSDLPSPSSKLDSKHGGHNYDDPYDNEYKHSSNETKSHK